MLGCHIRLLRRSLIALAACAAGAGVAPAAEAAKPAPKPTAPVTVAAVPPTFVGVDTDGPLFASDTTINLAAQFSSMVANGVESIRGGFNWANAQPYQSWSDVPAGQQTQFTDVNGVPTDFQLTDTMVGGAARAGISVLPTVEYAPPWDARPNPGGYATPSQDGPYAAYLTALIDRYGPSGSFWTANPAIPRRPIRAWQIWNEPNLSMYWPQPFAASYITLLRAARAAIKKADPGAEVVLGALTNFAWEALGSIYEVPGARALFDAVAVNGFTRLPSDVILYMHYVRNAMDRFGDRGKPLLATEVSWPSALGKFKSSYDFNTTPAGQARDIAQLLPLIGKYRTRLGLGGFYYYTWMGDESAATTAFDYAGLVRFANGRVTAKPALGAFRTGALALERCRRKGTMATVCIR